MAIKIYDYHTDWNIQSNTPEPSQPTASAIDTQKEVYNFLDGYKSDQKLKDVIDEAIQNGGIDDTEAAATPKIDSTKEVYDFLEGFDRNKTLQEVINDQHQLDNNEMNNLTSLFPTS